MTWSYYKIFVLCIASSTRLVASFTKFVCVHKILNLQRLKSVTVGEEWSTSVIPSGYKEVEQDMLAALDNGLRNLPRVSQTAGLLSIDLLTPGLNPKLEQKAYLPKELLFDLVYIIFPVLQNYYKRTKILFQSTGDAAGFQSQMFRERKDIHESIILSDLSIFNLNEDDECCVFVTAKNNLGDPVIDQIQEIVQTYTNLTAIFLNCDLSDRVTSGMRTKEIRNAFRNSIQPVYYFRNVVRIQRPSLEPVELGALRFAYPGLETGETTQWELYAAERGNRMDGPGCLNRFMRREVFRRKPEDATAENPPRFLLVAKYPKYPTREMLDKGIGEASGAVARLQRLESNPSSVSVTASQRAPSTSSSSSSSSVNRIGNATLEELTQLFRQTVSSR